MPNKIIIPFTLPWNWSADYQRQTCLELSKNHQVIAYMNDDSHFFLKKSPNQYPNIKNIHFYIPKYYLPFRRFSIIEKINSRLSLFFLSIRYIFDKKIIWIFDPQFVNWLRFFPNDKSIYDCVDYHSSFDKKEDKRIRKLEKKLIKKSKYFFVISRTLKLAHSKIRKATITPQGFKIGSFRFSHPKKKNTKPIIGYIGAINYRFNFTLLDKLIKNNPHIIFQFWGTTQEGNSKTEIESTKKINHLKKYKNTYWSMAKTDQELSNAINGFDIAIIPYDISQKINLLCYPMKFIEYLYFGKKIISTPILELKRNKFKDYVTIAYNYEEWQESIKTLLEKNFSNDQKQKMKNFAKKNSWERKIDKILETIKI